MNGLGAMRTGLMNHCGVANAIPDVSRASAVQHCVLHPRPGHTPYYFSLVAASRINARSA
jgi:hypothetical protein